MSQTLTSAEVACRLGITSRRVRSLIQSNRLPAHRALPDEVAALLSAGRITSMPATGLWLVEESDLPLVADRHVGRPRKERPDTE